MFIINYHMINILIFFIDSALHIVKILKLPNNLKNI